MHRILIMYDVWGWAYWRRAVALQKHAPDDFEVDIVSALDMDYSEACAYDLVFNLEYSHAKHARNNLKKCVNPPLLVTSHNSDSRRRHEFWWEVYNSSDYAICNNREVFEFFERMPRSCNISNGIDFDDFHPTVPIADRPHKIGWTGSSGIKKGKGYQDLLMPARHLLEQRGFICDFRPIDDTPAKLPDTVMFKTDRQREWYNECSYIVCASLTEGTPNYLLEGAASGCVPVSTKVGNIQEFGDEHNCVLFNRDLESLLTAMEVARESREELSANAVKDLQSWSYVERAPYFFALFRRLLNGDDVPPFTYQELKPEEI